MDNMHPVMAAALAPFAPPRREQRTQHQLGIDVLTGHKRELIRRLSALPTTTLVQDGGMYASDNVWSQVWLTTSLTPDQLENWLYTTVHGIEYVGVFVRGEV